MPIKPENQWRYPPNWPEISARIRARAWNACEECHLENYALGGRDEEGLFWPAIPKGTSATGLDWPKPGEWATCQRPGSEIRCSMRIIRIVLTVAHLDNRPENCADENLKALCQRCHNRLDRAYRQANAAKTRRKRAAMRDLFEGESAPGDDARQADHPRGDALAAVGREQRDRQIKVDTERR